MAWVCPDCHSLNTDSSYPNCVYSYLHKKSGGWWQCGHCGKYNDGDRSLCESCGTDKNVVKPRATS